MMSSKKAAEAQTKPVYARLPSKDIGEIEDYIRRAWTENVQSLTRSDVVRMAVHKFLEEDRRLRSKPKD